MNPFLIACVLLAAEPSFQFDFENNIISGDVYPGPLLQTLAAHGEALEACLVGAAPIFDAVGLLPSVDIRVAGDGTLQEFGFRDERLASVNACLNAAIDGVVLPVGKYGTRMGIIKLRPAGTAAPEPGGTRSLVADGLSLTLTAAPVAQGAGWGITTQVQATPVNEARAIGAEALVVVPTIYHPDGSSSHVGSWSIGDQNPAPCVAAGQAHGLTGATLASDVAQPGDVVRARVVLTHGPCEDAMAQRTVVGAVEMIVPSSGGPTVTVWAPSLLDGMTEPYEEVRVKARGY